MRVKNARDHIKRDAALEIEAGPLIAALCFEIVFKPDKIEKLCLRSGNG
jgi:hypothetical protein